LKYLKQIDKVHDEFLIHKHEVLPELEMIPVLVLDGNKPFEKCDILFNEYCDQIEDFMHKTHLRTTSKERQISL